tara:strand:+ start:1066 stop:1737 length:672 start_codon:yes stop_codon:yes gene_type:complete
MSDKLTRQDAPMPQQKPSAEVIESALREKHNTIGLMKTPSKYKKRRPDGFDYVDEGYMRHQLNQHYPAWSWQIVDTEWLGSEWIIVRGELHIIDNGVPRKYASIGATRIQFKRDKKTGLPMEHSPDNVVDIDKNVATANTNAFKRAVNRLCDIANDVYKKSVEDLNLTEEQKVSINKLIEEIDDETTTNKVISGIEDLSINKDNFDVAYNKLLTMKGEDNDKS